MKKFMSVLLACVLLFSVSMTGAQAEGIYYGIVNGGNANRVNLRASTSVSSQSLGVYYTGTPVVCMGDAGHGWTQVYVGRTARLHDDPVYHEDELGASHGYGAGADCAVRGGAERHGAGLLLSGSVGDDPR